MKNYFISENTLAQNKRNSCVAIFQEMRDELDESTRTERSIVWGLKNGEVVEVSAWDLLNFCFSVIKESKDNDKLLQETSERFRESERKYYKLRSKYINDFDKHHNQGKPKWSLLLTDFADELREVLRVREVIEATGKYDRMNFAMSQGKPEAKVFLEDNLDSMERHLFDRRANKHMDNETKCYHMAHICVRALMDLSYALHDNQALSYKEGLEYALESKSTIKDCTDLGTQGDLANDRTKKTYQIVDFVRNGSFRCDNCDRQSRCYEDFGEGGVDCKLASTQIYKESRYPWHEAPEWATCAAVDSDTYGIWYADERPEPNDRQWISDYRLARIGFRMLRDGEDWRTTLEMRPK
jgi:hypothetical protein